MERRVNHMLVKLTGREFVDIVGDVNPEAGEDQLAKHVQRVQEAHPGKIITYLIEGVAKFLEQQKVKLNNLQKQRIKARLERGGVDDADVEETESPNGDQDQEKQKEAKRMRITKRMVEEGTVWLQINAKCHIRQTKDATESAEYILRLTNAIASAPYRCHSTTNRTVTLLDDLIFILSYLDHLM